MHNFVSSKRTNIHNIVAVVITYLIDVLPVILKLSSHRLPLFTLLTVFCKHSTEWPISFSCYVCLENSFKKLSLDYLLPSEFLVQYSCFIVATTKSGFLILGSGCVESSHYENFVFIFIFWLVIISHFRGFYEGAFSSSAICFSQQMVVGFHGAISVQLTHLVGHLSR